VKLTCIVCPRGCQIYVQGTEVRGHACPRGRNWALEEYTNPKRTLTTTVALEGGDSTLLPVRTQAPVPKAKLLECMAHANRLRASTPITAGTPVCTDLAGTGVRLVAARTVR